MTTPSSRMGADALAKRLSEIDALREQGVLSADEHTLARQAAVNKAMETGAASADVPGASSPPPSKVTKHGMADAGPRVRAGVIAAIAAVAVVAIGIAIGIVVTQGGDDRPPPVAAAPEPAPRAPSRAASLVAYTGGSFSIYYPQGWIRETTDADMGGYFDTTWVSRQGKDAILRVNTSPGDPADGRESALALERGTSSTPGYQRVSMTSTTLAGMPATRWEFLTTGDSGRTLRTVNVLATDGVDGWAVLTRNPVAQDAKWSPIFREARASFEVR